MSIFVRPTLSTKRKKTKWSQISNMIPNLKWKTWIVIGVSIGIVLVILGLGDRLLVRSERYRIKIIEVHHTNPVPYTQLQDDNIVAKLTNKHYYLTKYSSTLANLITTYPPVVSLDLQPSLQTNIYKLVIGYAPVDAILRFQNVKYGLVKDQLYPLNTSSSWLILDIPSYSTGMSLSWLFYQVAAEQLSKQYQAIINWLQDQDIQRMTYHVAAHQIQVNTSTQEIYLNISGNIFEQLKKYRALTTNKDEIPFQRVIDLGTLEYGVFIYP